MYIAKSAHFYWEIDENSHCYETMGAADIKEEPYAPTGDNDADVEDTDYAGQSVLTGVPQIYCERKQGLVEIRRLDTKGAICISDIDNACLRTCIIEYMKGVCVCVET